MRLTGHEDHSRHRRTVVVSKRLKEGRSVLLRHPQVAHDQVIPHLLASTEGLGSARRRIDLMAESDPSRVSQLAGRSAAAAQPASRSKTTQNVRLMTGPSLPRDESKVRAMTRAGVKSDTSTGIPIGMRRSR